MSTLNITDGRLGLFGKEILKYIECSKIRKQKKREKIDKTTESGIRNKR